MSKTKINKGIMQISQELEDLIMGKDIEIIDCQCDLCNDTGSMPWGEDGDETAPCTECDKDYWNGGDVIDMSGSCGTNDR